MYEQTCIVNPLVSLRMSPDSMAPACSFHREKHIEALLSATRHLRTTLPSFVWLVEPASEDMIACIPKENYHVTIYLAPFVDCIAPHIICTDCAAKPYSQYSTVHLLQALT